MRSAAGAALVVLVATTGPALPQGNDATTAAGSAGGRPAVGVVQIGAGSTSEVTTGSSGPKGDGSDPLPALPAPFSIVPPQQSFFGPGSLPIRPPERLRCDVIDDAPAKARCEARATAGRPDPNQPPPTGVRTP